MIMLAHRKETAKLWSKGIDETKIPHVLILRGVRDRTGSSEAIGRYFDNVESLRMEGMATQDIFLGERNGIRCAFASVYGASMAEEVVRRFGQVGVKLVLHTGCCIAKTRRIKTGDLVIATEAYQGNGVRGYSPQVRGMKASYEGAELSALHAMRTTRLHWGRVYSTARDFCLEEYLPPSPFVADCWVVDRETAAVFSASEHYGIHRSAILYVTDPDGRENPAPERHGCCRCGEELMLGVLVAILKSYSEKIRTTAPHPTVWHSNQLSLPAEQDHRKRFWQAAIDSKM